MKKKLHILFLCGWYPSKVFSTNGDFIQRHAEAVDLLHTVSILHIVSDKNIIQRTKIEHNIINGINTYIGYAKYSKNPVIKFIRFWKLYVEILKKIGEIDIVHLNTLFPFGLFAIHLKWFQKIKFIISEHWTGYLHPNSKNISFLEKIFSKIICKNASYICPVSNHLANSMQNIGLKGNYKIVPNVVDTSLFVPKEKESTSFNIVHISSMLNEHKNIFGMLEVAKKLEDSINGFNWTFIGGITEEITTKVDSLKFKNNTVKFIKHLPHKELISYLQDASVFVLFSNYENLPCVILESFSCGIPVISTNVGGISEFFPNGYGKLIEKENQKQLLDSLQEFYPDFNANKQKMHTYAIENFGKETIAKTFSNLYYSSL